MQQTKKKIILSITGASGSIYAKKLVDSFVKFKAQIDNVAVVFSENAVEVWKHEIGEEELKNIPFTIYKKNDFSAPFASGSSDYNLNIVAPCSMGTLARISNGISNDLITRTADVFLKERRKLILLIREMPFSLIHIKNMEKITLAGGIICPAIPSFYSKPKSIEDLTQTVIDRILDLSSFEIDTFRWSK